ncbi:hypothetical protein [Nitrosomonas communis]|uniref:hypothetical protein n=1 Tax=Nitrosomonas communis TaxID=44574 RepID=UPI003D2E231D
MTILPIEKQDEEFLRFGDALLEPDPENILTPSRLHHIWEIGEFGKADHIPNNRCFDLTAINPIVSHLRPKTIQASSSFFRLAHVCYFCDNRLVIGPG